MTLANLTFLRQPVSHALTRHVSLIAASLCLAGGSLVSASAHATKPAADLAAAPATQVALQQWPENSAPSSLIPKAMLPERLGDRTLQTLAEEASKQAQTKYLAKKLRKPVATVRQFVNMAWEEADKRAGLEPELLIAIIQKESSFSPKVQSAAGAQGLMQVIRRWHRDKLHPSESLFDPQVNIRVGADILEEYLERAEGSLAKALAKYSGNTPGYANTVMKESRKLARVADQAAAQIDASPS